MTHWDGNIRKQDGAHDTLSLSSLFVLARRQIRLIALTAFAVIAVGFLYVTVATPIYTATALIRIDPEERNLLDPVASGVANAAVDSTRIETEVEILRSDQLALQTIETLALFNTGEFGPRLSLMARARAALGLSPGVAQTGAGLLNATLGNLRQALTIRRRGLTYIVSVQAVSSNPEQAAQIANAHARTYIDDQVAARLSGVLSARDVLTGQLDAAQTRLTASNSALRGYVEDNVMVLARDSGNADLARVGAELRQASDDLARLQLVADRARQAEGAQDWAGLVETLEDAALGALERQRVAFQQRLDAAAPDSTASVDLRASLDQLHEQMRAQSDAARAALDLEAQGLRDTRLTLLDAAQAQVLETALSAGAVSEIYALQQEAGIAQRQYDQLLARIRDLETQAALQLPSSRIVSEALVPVRSSAPNVRLILMLAAIAGVGLGFGLALLKEFIFGGITSARQLANVLDLPVGAEVPRIASEPGNHSIADHLHLAPMSRFAEEYRKLRAVIDGQLRDAPKDKGRTVLVTSALPAEGKSSTALSLARTYAAAGKRVLLMDCDLRNPSLHLQIGASPEAGLLDYLLHMQGAEAGQRDASDVSSFYVDDPHSSASVILGRQLTDVPTDVPMQSHALGQVIANARESFDLIVLDSAPLGPVVDTRYLAPLADVALICVRYAMAGQSELRAAVGLLAETMPDHGRCICVLNEIPGREIARGYSGYGDNGY